MITIDELARKIAEAETQGIDAITKAWLAHLGYTPDQAVLVRQYTDTGVRIWIEAREGARPAGLSRAFEAPYGQPMTIEQAHQITDDHPAWIDIDTEDGVAVLDGRFSIEDLQAITTLMQKNPK
jgi:hypothetical protein